MYSLKITSYASTAANPNRYRRFDYDYFVAVVDFVVVDSVEIDFDFVELVVGNWIEVDETDFDSAEIDRRKAVEKVRESYCLRDKYYRPESYCHRDKQAVEVCFVRAAAAFLQLAYS